MSAFIFSNLAMNIVLAGNLDDLAGNATLLQNNVFRNNLNTCFCRESAGKLFEKRRQRHCTVNSIYPNLAVP